MAERLRNIAGLFKEGRTRTIILTTLVVLVLAIVVGVFSMRARVKGVPAAAGVAEAPGNLQSVPFEAPNAEYARLQAQQNKQESATAEQQKTSAIPTIYRSGKDSGPEPAAVSDTGVGFTALGREQSDAGTFSPKEFNTGKEAANCPVASSANASSLGTPIYDKNGRLIGYADANGKVRDLNGNVIGTVGPDGFVRDASGNIIGQINNPLAGTPVYDEHGNLIGYVGADGKVRDAAGNIIGTLGADGVLRDANGKILGRVGTPVYGPDGKLIGFAGPDGKIRDANGNIIGTVGPDGVARDLNGNIIGRAGAISPGTPVYGPDGKIIGYVGPDGKVRDLNGNVIGTVGVDGIVRDINGNIIGSITQPPVAAAKNTAGTVGAVAGSAAEQAQAAADAEARAAESAAARQAQIARDQSLQQTVQQKQQSMTNQANQLLAAWSSPLQQMVSGQDNAAGANGGSAEGASGAAAAGSTASGQAATGPVFIKAGTIYYGIINTAVNSDEPGPIMATIINGPYKNGKLLGTLSNQGQAVMLSFNTLSLPNFPKSIAINAVAIDQDTARTGLSTETNNHYLLRYGAIFASAFIQGYGQAFQTSGSTISSNGLSTQSATPNLSGAAKFYVALGTVGQQFSSQAQNIFNTPPTVHVASGTAVGLLFLTDVQMPSA